MSDWFGVYSIDHALNSGLDLEMPGTNKWRTLDLVNRSINARKVTVRTVKQRAAKVLEMVQKCAQGAPEVRIPHINSRALQLILCADFGWRRY